MTAEDEDLAAAAEPTTTAEPTDNSISRLLTLSDGVFAIAMTLLALDLKVPSAAHSDAELRRQLAHHVGTYLSFLLSFYVVGSYWGRHRRLMQSVRTTHPDLIRDTLVLLLIVAAMPFPASLLGLQGDLPSALALYCAANALAGITLMVLSRDVRRLGVGGDSSADYVHNARSWINLAVFVLGIPAAYLLGSHGPYFLLLLAVPGRAGRVWRWFDRSGLQGLRRRFQRPS